jgi:hypothetical protein
LNRGILHEVRSLRERGYSVADIARKIGTERMYVSGIVHLVEHKEATLIEAIDKCHGRYFDIFHNSFIFSKMLVSGTVVEKGLSLIGRALGIF